MKNVFFFFFRCFRTIRPIATDIQVADGAFYAMALALYFSLTPLIDLGEWASNTDIGVAGTVSIWGSLCLILYFMILHKDKWKDGVKLLSIPLLSKQHAWFCIITSIAVALALILFPIGQFLK